MWFLVFVIFIVLKLLGPSKRPSCSPNSWIDSCTQVNTWWSIRVKRTGYICIPHFFIQNNPLKLSIILLPLQINPPLCVVFLMKYIEVCGWNKMESYVPLSCVATTAYLSPWWGYPAPAWRCRPSGWRPHGESSHSRPSHRPTASTGRRPLTGCCRAPGSHDPLLNEEGDRGVERRVLYTE